MAARTSERDGADYLCLLPRHAQQLVRDAEAAGNTVTWEWDTNGTTRVHVLLADSDDTDWVSAYWFRGRFAYGTDGDVENMNLSCVRSFTTC